MGVAFQANLIHHKGAHHTHFLNPIGLRHLLDFPFTALKANERHRLPLIRRIVRVYGFQAGDMRRFSILAFIERLGFPQHIGGIHQREFLARRGRHVTLRHEVKIRVGRGLFSRGNIDAAMRSGPITESDVLGYDGDCVLVGNIQRLAVVAIGTPRK